MLGAPAGQVLDLLATRDARRDDLGVGGGRLHGRRQPAVAERDRDVVVLPLEAERAGHAAAARVDLAHLEPAQRSAATVGAVPTSAFWWQWPCSSARLAPVNASVEAALALAQEELLEQQALPRHRPRLVGAQQVHPLVAQGQQARRLEAHDGDAAGA